MKRKNIVLLGLVVLCIALGLVLAGCEEETYYYKFWNDTTYTFDVKADGQTFKLYPDDRKTIESKKSEIEWEVPTPPAGLKADKSKPGEVRFYI